MKFKMNTAKMNSILARLAKGVGSSKILPITEYLKLELKDGVLTMVATDSSNFIEYSESGIEGEDGIAIVKADKLIKLVSKTTKQEVSFELKSDHLEVKGNGTYKVELFETNEYPTYEFNENAPMVTVKTEVLKKVFSVNEAAIATDMLMPCLTGYNIGDNAVTTDGVKMCFNEVTIFTNQRALIPQKLADLLSVLNTEDVEIRKDGNKLLFKAGNVTIFGTELDGIEEYPDISPILSIPYSNYAVIRRQSLIDTLERVSLFLDSTSNNGVKLTFKSDGLYVTDLKDKTCEVIEYISNTQEEQDVELVFNLKYLKDLLEALSKESAEVFYGTDLPIKLKEDTVTLLLSTMSTE
jgi:DNA polymerase III subunit beta